MSEVDRLSNSGLYPALPIADKRSRKDGPDGQHARQAAEESGRKRRAKSGQESIPTAEIAHR